MNYSDIKTPDVANGPGIRVSIFASGCRHHCKGCFNKETRDFNYGKPFTQETIDYILKLMEPTYIKGITFLGGEPMEPVNQEGLLLLAKAVKEKYPEKTIWCYTGFLFDRDILNNMYKNSDTTKELVNLLDVVVDGKFEESLKDVRLKFKGSSNQRTIDVKKTLETGKIEILW